MRKYLIWIIANVIILSIGFYIGTHNERINVNEVQTEFLDAYKADKIDLTKNQLEEKYSRYFDYMNVSFDEFYTEFGGITNDYVIYQKIFSYQVILVGENSEPNIDSFQFEVSRYLGNGLPYDYLFIGIISVINMIGMIIMQSKKNYYLYTLLDKVTFLSVIIMFFFIEMDYGTNVYNTIIAVHLLLLIGHYLYLIAIGKRRYIIKSNQDETEKIFYALKEGKDPIYVTQKQSVAGTYNQCVVTKDEEDGLFEFLDVYMKPKEFRYAIINFVALGILSGIALYFFIINLWN